MEYENTNMLLLAMAEVIHPYNNFTHPRMELVAVSENSFINCVYPGDVR